MCNVSPDDRISAEGPRTRLKLKIMRECLEHRSLQWFGPPEKMEDNSWSSKRRIFKVSSSFRSGRPRKTWNEIIIRSDLHGHS